MRNQPVREAMNGFFRLDNILRKLIECSFIVITFLYRIREDLTQSCQVVPNFIEGKWASTALSICFKFSSVKTRFLVSFKLKRHPYLNFCIKAKSFIYDWKNSLCKIIWMCRNRKSQRKILKLNKYSRLVIHTNNLIYFWRMWVKTWTH